MKEARDKEGWFTQHHRVQAFDIVIVLLYCTLRGKIKAKKCAV